MDFSVDKDQLSIFQCLLMSLDDAGIPSRFTITTGASGYQFCLDVQDNVDRVRQWACGEGERPNSHHFEMWRVTVDWRAVRVMSC